jgi:hypothetical protein
VWWLPFSRKPVNIATQFYKDSQKIKNRSALLGVSANADTSNPPTECSFEHILR